MSTSILGVLPDASLHFDMVCAKCNECRMQSRGTMIIDKLAKR